MSQTASTEHVLPIPLGFPVEWSEPTDAQLLWVYNPAYYGKPMPPLDFALGAKPALASSSKIMAIYGVPMQSRSCQMNGYVYSANIITDSKTEPAKNFSQSEINALVGNLRERWDTQWLPEIEEHLRMWDTFDLTQATLPELLSHLEMTERSSYRLQEIHLGLIVPVLTALQLFAEMIEDIFPVEPDPDLNSGEEPTIDPYELLIGFDTRGIQSSQALWQLSQFVQMEPEVYWIFQEIHAETRTEDLLTMLALSDEGQEFLDELHAYLQKFGYQGEKNYLSSPTWREDPMPAIQTIQAYLAQSEHNLEEQRNSVVVRREAAVAAVRERMNGYPQPIVDHFEFLLEAAQTANWLREEHPHWLDLRLYDHVRQVILAVGERLCTAGAIAICDDVFYLTLAEVCSLYTQIVEGDRPVDRQHELITARRDQERHYAAYAPPAMLGTLQEQTPPDHPILKAISQLDGDSAAAPIQTGELRGQGASSGIVRGRACILHSPSEAAKLGAGDILVTVTTGPAWTPLYANLAGLITDTGGVLSHAAVVAREFGVPAVVGAGAATKLIKDGQYIELDGNRGMVRLDLDEPTVDHK